MKTVLRIAIAAIRVTLIGDPKVVIVGLLVSGTVAVTWIYIR
ncbi:MAG: hypothetical protein QM783_16035 [Phycisphaerales bacterium]